MKVSLPDRPLRVALNGLDSRAQTRMSMFLEGPARGVCEVVGEELAEAAIFDFDGFGGERLWHAFREHFHGPAVVMSVGEKHLHNAVWVRKPLNTQEFLAAIELVHQRLKTEQRLREIESAAEMEMALPATTAAPPVSPPPQPSVMVAPADEHWSLPRPSSGGVVVKSVGDAEGAGRAASLTWNEQQVHESCGALDDAVYLDPKRRHELYYEPAEYLQGMLQRACQLARKGSPVKVVIGRQAMIVLAGGQEVFSPTREQRLRPLSVTPTPSRFAALLDVRQEDLPEIPPQDPHLHRSETMLWTVSLWASRGRVPKGTDLYVPVSLVSWPGFSRLLITPHALQIAALWSTRPLSLMETARLLAIPHRYVFALYSACLALGLTETIPTAKQAVVSQANHATSAPAAKRGLMGSLLRKLRLAR